MSPRAPRSGIRRRRARGSGGPPPPDTLRGRVRPHDPFELIRWLALSQPDPRKALAELVQNSLDAGAGSVRVTRLRHRGTPCLEIFDDGAGVIPEMDRPEALKYVATHIGHSRKRSLSPQERLALMTQGQYGIGLLGFWSLGEMLEMRSAVPGQRPHRLILYRDRDRYLVEPLRGRLAMDERFTEVVVVGLHREALPALMGRRAADYLASELRGQLLSREVELAVEDRMSRGTAKKRIVVRPPRFLGERIEGIGPIEVPGHPPIRIEIYLGGETDEEGGGGGLAVYGSGTLVAASFRDLGALGLDRSPWTDPRLVGLVDFPGFRVAPGSRRGVFLDEAAGAFAAALGRVEPFLAGVLESLERRRSEELDRTLIRDLQKVFRDFYKQRPRYVMLPVRSARDAGGAASGSGEGTEAAGAPPGAALEGAGPGAAVLEEPSARRPRSAPMADLLPPGPLDAVRLVPPAIRIEIGATRRVRAEPLDARGRRVEDPVEWTWRLEGPVGSVEEVPDSPGSAILTAPAQPGDGRLAVEARSGDRRAAAVAEVEIVEELPARGADEGIPEPELLSQPAGSWRSRMLDGRWQVNTGHRDYRAIEDRPALKLRYLAMLFAKEVVLRSGGDPRLDKPLEQLVEVAAYADRALAKGRPRRRSTESRIGEAADAGD